MADSAERDAALLLDMLLAAQDARAFLEDLDEDAFRNSRRDQEGLYALCRG
jgi:uncharacterized protein with HEPN domain